MADTPIPPRPSVLRESVGEKISVTHHGEAPAAVADPPFAGSAEKMPNESMIERLRVLTANRPEIVIGAAFASGLLLATILKRLAR
jgi:hypothetical protein